VPLLRPRSTGEVVRVEEGWFVRRDGRFVPVAYSSTPVMVDRARGAVVVFRDITERHRAEAERRRLEERRRLGRDLHDGAPQRLVNVILALQLVSRHVTDDESKRLIANAASETQQAVEDLRNLASRRRWRTSPSMPRRQRRA
jgi:signal transduction histidine kinase